MSPERVIDRKPADAVESFVISKKGRRTSSDLSGQSYIVEGEPIILAREFEGGEFKDTLCASQTVLDQFDQFEGKPVENASRPDHSDPEFLKQELRYLSKRLGLQFPTSTPEGLINQLLGRFREQDKYDKWGPGTG